ncbi:hypothetical protein GLOIN_2v528075 [Rhizophagus irregularis DAOM 181602=DAOM 197198]|nr:hypothetical protein GLOIN_2v528075 [Rhizophagus irregularis DAOM 181602=DAOM 197198]
MSCNWLLVGKTHFCEKSARDQYCASHAFKIRKGVIIPQPCKGCGRGTKSRVQLCVQCGQDIHRTVLNILTGRWVKTNEDIGTIYVASRSDIHKNFPISVESAVVGGMSLFSLEKNKRSSFQNLMLMNYSNLSTLIGITWDREETKAWRNDIYS